MTDASDKLAEARRNAAYWQSQVTEAEGTSTAPPAETPSQPSEAQFGSQPFDAPTGPTGQESVTQLFDRLVASGARAEDAQAQVVAAMGGAAAAGDERYLVKSNPISVLGVVVAE
jgi:hypothetical protein